LGKELPGFGSRLRRKGKIRPQSELREMGRVVRYEVEHGHNVARGARGGARARQHWGRVAQLAESGHASGWG
jgi:hypothetical protein